MGHKSRKTRSPDKRVLGRQPAAQDGVASGTTHFGRDFWLAAAVCVLLLLAVLLVFGQTLSYDFVNFDDYAYVRDNPRVTHGLTARSVAWAFTSTRCSNWHPLTWLSLLADYQLYGLNPWGYHLTNVLLHAAAAIGLFLVLRRMTGDFWPSAFVAAVFAIHPLRVESVAWVSERKDVLCGLFFMLTLGAYVGYVRRPFSLLRYLLVVFWFVLGLMAKPMLVTLPCVLLLLDYWPLGRMTGWCAGSWSGSCIAAAGVAVQRPPQQVQRPPHQTWRLVVEKLPLLALSAASCAITPVAQGEAVARLDMTPLAARVTNMLISYVVYVRQLFYPVGLAAYYPHFGPFLPTWQIVVAAILLVGVCAAVVVWGRRCPYVLVGWCWYMGMLVPVIGLVQVGAQAMAYRYTYLPQIGLLIAVAWGAKHFLASWPYRTWAYSVAATLIVAALVGCSRQQATYWRDGETLWNRAIACTRFNATAHYNLGNILADKGRVEEAIAEYRTALQIRPKDSEIYNNLGNLLAQKGRLDEGIATLHTALQYDPSDPFIHNNLGVALTHKEQIDEAIAEYRKALDLKPDYVTALDNLGEMLDHRKQFDESSALYERSLKVEPNDENVWYALGVVRFKLGRTDEAISCFRTTLELKPNHAWAHHDLGIILAGRGQLDEAVVHFNRLVELDPKNPSARRIRDDAVARRDEMRKKSGQPPVPKSDHP
jgi:protein O-mannosyl-transferase